MAAARCRFLFTDCGEKGRKKNYCCSSQFLQRLEKKSSGSILWKPTYKTPVSFLLISPRKRRTGRMTKRRKRKRGVCCTHRCPPLGTAVMTSHPSLSPSCSRCRQTSGLVWTATSPSWWWSPIPAAWPASWWWRPVWTPRGRTAWSACWWWPRWLSWTHCSRPAPPRPRSAPRAPPPLRTGPRWGRQAAAWAAMCCCRICCRWRRLWRSDWDLSQTHPSPSRCPRPLSHSPAPTRRQHLILSSQSLNPWIRKTETVHINGIRKRK